MEGSELNVQLLVFRVHDERLAIGIHQVEQVLPSVWITPLPGAPEVVEGIVRVGNRVLPVFDLASRFFSSPRSLRLNDHLILANTSKRTVLLHVNQVEGLVECSGHSMEDRDSILPNLELIDGVLRLDDGIILIQALDRFLGLEEEEALESAMKART